MKTIKIGTVILVAALFSSYSWADGYIKLDGMYSSNESESGGVKSESSETQLSLGAGFVSQKGWVLGALYATEKTKSGGTSVDRSSMGPTVGWMSRKESGFYILGTYFITSEFADIYEGTGYQIDLGYKFRIRKIAFAPQFSYKKFEYDEANGAAISPPDKHGGIDPYFVFLIEF